MDRRALEETRSILRQIEELRRRLEQLLREHGLPGLTDEIISTLERVEGHARELAEREFRHALARVNFEDRTYGLLRVIDGDTIEVRPPEELIQWMRDVHIRLYGVDAPESGTELAPTYTKLLEKLCRLDEGRLYVVWERERQGTEYAGYPTTSFERGVGNVFVRVEEDRLLYVNGVLASLPDVRIERGSKQLIRAARHLHHLRHPFWLHRDRHRHWPFYSFWPWRRTAGRTTLDFWVSTDSTDLLDWARRSRYPHFGAFWIFPKEAVLHPTANLNIIQTFLEGREFRECPLCAANLRELVEEWPKLSEREDATQFDLVLLLAHVWSHGADEEADAT